MLYIRASAVRYYPETTCNICRCLRTTFPLGNNDVKVFFGSPFSSFGTILPFKTTATPTWRRQAAPDGAWWWCLTVPGGGALWCDDIVSFSIMGRSHLDEIKVHLASGLRQPLRNVGCPGCSVTFNQAGPNHTTRWLVVRLV